MALTLDYPDAYLARFCTDEREARAYADVDLLNTGNPFSTQWRDTLARLRCYIIACIENQAAPDDLFTSKLKSYRSEFDSAYGQAVAAADAAADSPNSALFFAIPIERA